MPKDNIQELLKTLLYYDDCEIVHKIRGENNTFSLSYSKERQTFQLENMETNYIERYTDIEGISLALFHVMQTSETKRVE